MATQNSEQMNGMDELKEFADKFAKSLEVLSSIDKIEIAVSPKETVLEEDKVKLYHYKAKGKAKCKTPLLIVYALVNRFEMMDLQPDRSIIQKLLDEGIDVYLLDWGYPTRIDRFKTIDDHINGHINDCVDHINEEHGIDKLNILGVCQGGTFSTIYASLYPEKVNGLITLVTPIDFSVPDGLLFNWAKGFDVDTVVDGYGGLVPGEFLNTGFFLLKPMSQLRKSSANVDLIQDKAKALNFLRMEKWINDSPAQAGETFRQFMKDCFQENKLMKGEMVIGKDTIDFKKVKCPLLNIYAEADHLVPPSSSIPLNDLVGSKDTESYKFPGGHIGVFVGSRSQKELAPTIAKWLIIRSK